MPAYALGNLRPPAGTDVPEEVLTYMERVQATLGPFGGTFLVHGAPEREVREGAWPSVLVIIGFPSLDAARAWYDSEAYQALIPLRTRHMAGDVLLVDGLPPGYDPATTAARIRTAQSATLSTPTTA
ncbi:DUF1330 domain-containing protein [Streptomyces sp. LP05-1]|uniref:DUF1330 domain-containing protein n=1 Tax=Streptomyces pyxinae TaxID=2970734 RepID=A0ABT2CAX6_9ACTN|nr:DUF1330 domain-containing protein [Streptomyces sp. LP05-1]MCS0634565.1 DUF1330 domain-containing protein [Streptomyces sp. LP05-1]